MERIFGFRGSDFSSWAAFVRLMNRPMDPASLGITRILFGVLMVLDGLQERGMAYADYRWGEPNECRFPLFGFLRPLPLVWMYVLYLVMFLGSIGIICGLFYRVASAMFLVPYWYFVMLEKTTWNCHSYLFGLMSFMMFLADANRYASLDGLLNPKIRNAHVPLWNYAMVRFQFFLVYFLAGVKKLDADWRTGQSMNNLSQHWVFRPFALVMSDDAVDFYMVHMVGLVLDISIGYLLYFDATRPAALVFGVIFHTMNSLLFKIGMFPFIMLFTLPLFCHVDWPRRFINNCPPALHIVLPTLEEPQYSEHCIYPKEVVKPEERDTVIRRSRVVPRNKAGQYHNIAIVGFLTYLVTQCLLPYSHSITQGYNNWTNGLYGYSWDMMVHNWNTQRIAISYKVKNTGEIGYVNPQAFCRSGRWHAHADMLKQHAVCVEAFLARERNITGVEIYYDIWRSLNNRFQQRMFDSRVDMLTAHWSPWEKVSWVLPLLTDLSDWRGKLKEIRQDISGGSEDKDVVFIADFPGLRVENYIQPEFGDTSLQVLKGQVVLELLGHGEEESKNITVTEGKTVQIPAGEYHNVHTVTDQPSCYMYIYTNTTEATLRESIAQYEDLLSRAQTSGGNITALNDTFANVLPTYNKIRSLAEKREREGNLTVVENLFNLVLSKYKALKRGLTMMRVALQSILTGQTFLEVFNATVRREQSVDFGIGLNPGVNTNS